MLAVFFAGGAVLLAGCMQAPERMPAMLAGATPHVQAGSPADAGRYLVYVGGCNDCHTPGFNESGGSTPEADWLTGSPVGFRGPWGTTYPSNLRLLVQDINEDAWVTMLRTRKALPPMPWPNMNRLSERWRSGQTGSRPRRMCLLSRCIWIGWEVLRRRSRR